MSEMIVQAPLAGWLTPLAEVPDAAFAGGMVGEGVAVDPTDTVVRAPFDGVVVGLPSSRHAVTVRSVEGVEVLIHVGLDTVGLNGAGFVAHVTEGASVRAGDPLLTLDLNIIVDGAISLVTPVVVVGGAASVQAIAPGRSVRAGEPILKVSVATQAGVEEAGEVLTARVAAPLPHGLHARPAGRIAACVRGFDARVVLSHGDRQADAASLVAMMGLGVKDGDELVLKASGRQAHEALSALTALIAAGLEEGAHETPKSAAAPAARTTEPVVGEDGELILSGVTAAPGLVIGRAVRLTQSEIAVAEDGGGVAVETARLNAALSAVRARIEQAATSGNAHRRAILAAHLGFLDDPGLIAGAEQAAAEGRSAGFAWRQSTRAAADLFRTMGDPRMAERADDLLDLERQVLIELSGEAAPAPAAIGPGSVIVADDLLPSQLMALDAVKVAGLCTAQGGPTSHVAILAAAMGVPALVAVGAALDRVDNGVLVVLDADGRQLIANPSAARQAGAQSAVAARDRRRADARALALDACHTADGARIEVFANLGDAAEAAPAVAGGAEGCGLLRTEFLFLERETAPTEDEQLVQYQAIADALDGRPLIIRTLDAGGDKPLPYLPMPHEENPALGLRGVRSGLHRPDILLAQLRAICRVRSKGTVAVMLPMIASVAEVRQVRAMLDVAVAETDGRAPVLGVMIETPAAAMTVDRLAPAIDFISIGTNDLTQYALAMDRQNAALAAQLDSLHPAVLRLIAQASGSAAALKWIGVCGGLASDVLAAPILIGLGVRELSATPSMVAEVKAVVRSLTLADCSQLAASALSQDSAEAVRALATERLGALVQSRAVGAVA
ncbi:phosphoenolpyruvate--protein phosphotransferase [Brevundimonas nasdae]|uniref:phosphoenolpyruvate--protein phosphotransferase n=1 Tax=Brevundimonas nasdae TaxID=172043 RepID=A0ABX8TQA0_9CAUL|nr:phosphoenolpyruvate--protein phosphotransferase [Brevundimonas nasdae]QYC15879.1 phosphoenolpyruvate--protein phosphotransferase [Brevundimonas nasdae]